MAQRSRVALWLAGVIGLAVAARCTDLGARLTMDDAYTWLTASSPNVHVFLARLAANENSPPLIYLLVGAMPSFAPAWLRVPSVTAGVLLPAVLFACVRPRLGARAALLGALGVAVAPYMVTYSNLARGFMPADLALLFMLWCLLAQADDERPWRWAAFVLAGAVAVYTEYGSVVFVVAAALAALWIGRPRRGAVVVATAAVLLALVPWIPEIVRGEQAVGHTKFNPLDASPSLTALRDLVGALAFGENGGTASAAGRWLILIAVLALAAAGLAVVRRGWDQRPPAAQDTARLLAGTVLLTLIGYALAAVVGVDIFTQRYLTAIVAPVAALAAWALTCVAGRRTLAVAAILLAAVGIANAVRRAGTEFEPSVAALGPQVRALHPRTVLTNTPTVLYYLRDLHPIFDRPYNIGPGRAATCARPCVVVDDSRVHGGTPRPVSGTARSVAPFVIVDEP
ncbi:MAG TPA: glycosyltransferase family 39 protein [Solirubrobacteraceae bacterium]|nr:glycosyltransferase family 39 protein [Solirubrobacteraceae bacterium]